MSSNENYIRELAEIQSLQVLKLREKNRLARERHYRIDALHAIAKKDCIPLAPLLGVADTPAINAARGALLQSDVEYQEFFNDILQKNAALDNMQFTLMRREEQDASIIFDRYAAFDGLPSIPVFLATQEGFVLCLDGFSTFAVRHCDRNGVIQNKVVSYVVSLTLEELRVLGLTANVKELEVYTKELKNHLINYSRKFLGDDFINSFIEQSFVGKKSEKEKEQIKSDMKKGWRRLSLQEQIDQLKRIYRAVSVAREKENCRDEVLFVPVLPVKARDSEWGKIFSWTVMRAQRGAQRRRISTHRRNVRRSSGHSSRRSRSSFVAASSHAGSDSGGDDGGSDDGDGQPNSYHEALTSGQGNIVVAFYQPNNCFAESSIASGTMGAVVEFFVPFSRQEVAA